MPPVRLVLRVAVLAACLLPGSALAASLSGAAAVAALNAQRGANGIPADVVARNDWSAACAAHARYLERTGGLTTTEDPRRRGYSKQGAWAAANAALTRDVWTAAHDPWAQMPVQAMQLLSPLLSQLGVGSSSHYVCATARPGWLRQAPAQPSLYPYPGDGAAGVPFAVWSYDFPETPGDLVGLPAGFGTGPNLLVMADIPGQANVTHAQLVGPTGAVEVRTVDNTVADLGDQLAPGAILIPVDPLKPGRTYTASVALRIAGRSLSRTWSFTTAKADPQTLLFVTSGAWVDPAAPGGIRQGAVAGRSSSPAPLHFTVSAGSQQAAAVDLASGETWTPPQTPGRYRVCAHQDATDDFAAFDRCAPLRIRELSSFVHPTKITVKGLGLSGRKLHYALVVSPALRRRVTVRARRFVNGAWHTYRTVTRDARRTVPRTITSRSSDQTVQMVITVPAGRLGAETYRAATVVRTVHRR